MAESGPMRIGAGFVEDRPLQNIGRIYTIYNTCQLSDLCISAFQSTLSSDSRPRRHLRDTIPPAQTGIGHFTPLPTTISSHLPGPAPQQHQPPSPPPQHTSNGHNNHPDPHPRLSLPPPHSFRLRSLQELLRRVSLPTLAAAETLSI